MKKTGEKGRFTSEDLVGNQFKKGTGPNKTSFKKGVTFLRYHPSWKGGIQKTRDGYYIAYEAGKRMPRARYVWWKVYGEMPPDGYIIYHKDGDRYNDDIDNLEIITRKDLLNRNRHDRVT